MSRSVHEDAVRQPRCYEFCFPDLDTLIQVEELEDSVVVRATRDSFSERRKICFIRELAAEGFIDDSYRWFSGFGQGTFLAVRWQVDYSWLKPDQAAVARTRRFMIRLLMSAVLLWLGIMSVLLLVSK